VNGTAILGTDFTLGQTPGQVTLLCGQRSATVTLHALAGTSAHNSRNLKANLMLRENSQYRLDKKAKYRKAAVAIRR
jgi:hypothetical protein